MRQIVMVTAAVVMLAAGAHEARAQDVSFGIKGGTIGASVAARGPAGFDADAELGPALGIFLSVDLGAGIRLQPEVLFASRRFTSADLPLPLAVDSRTVELPILVHTRFSEGRRVRPVLFAGPHMTLIGTVTQTFGSTEWDISDDIKSVDLGVTAGGGVEVRAGRGAVVMDARACFGLQDVSARPEVSLKSRGFLILFGYRF